VNQLDGMVIDVHRVDPNHAGALLKRPAIIYRPDKGVDCDDGFMGLCIGLDTPRRMQEEINVPRRGH
jgi:hypothetical protein